MELQGTPGGLFKSHLYYLGKKFLLEYFVTTKTILKQIASKLLSHLPIEWILNVLYFEHAVDANTSLLIITLNLNGRESK